MSKEKKVNNKNKAKEKISINYRKIFFSVLIISISAVGAEGVAFGISQAKKAKAEKQVKKLHTMQIKGDE